jgi:CTP:molybdopterin cytidylyltransferase MocA
MRAIIICAGEAARWGNYLNTAKHLVLIDGEPILYRLVRLLRDRGVTDIYIVSKDDPRYKVDGASQFVARLNYEENADADKFLSSKELWSKEGRTVVFYGDTYFTDEAIETIVSHEGKDWVLFCRPKASDITGSPWPECFAQSFYPHQIQQHEAALHRIACLYKQGRLKRCGGWEHYRVMAGINPKKRKEFGKRLIVIDDFTDDFDYPKDYDEFILRHNRANLPRGIDHATTR